ncbi:TPA: amino acid-binding ACT domain protein [Candidatus Micrarchaeota archaeon]|nr:amino acid-binding ACT domain protein [Candidatus Micrarchaeota archaeon]HIH30805.1 amino acid-binding ACT domain protein [Candidatus Micrarchaeota archaeon]
MLRYLEEHFAGQRAKLRVVTEMLRLGLRVGEKGKLYCGNIELAPAKVARALSVDRRVVIETCSEIAYDENLYRIFSELVSVAKVSGAAKRLGHDVIEIEADPDSLGVVAKVAGVLSRHNVKIRQIIADDPDLYPEPKMHVVVNGKLPQKAASALRSLGLKSVSFK